MKGYFDILHEDISRFELCVENSVPHACLDKRFNDSTRRDDQTLYQIIDLFDLIEMGLDSS